MKYLKTYENNNETFWVYIELSTTFPEVKDTQIFYDKESAENYFITQMNEISDKNIYTVEEAEEYVSDNEISVIYYKVECKGKFELSEEFKRERDSKKYNL